MFKKGLIFVLCAPTMVWAQFTVATISGTVTDEAGTPLGKVKVTVRHLDTGRNWSVLTDDSGKYHATSLPLGSYLVESSREGLTTVFRGTPLRSAREVVLNLTMKKAGLTRRVEGEAPAEPQGPQTSEPSSQPAPGARGQSADLRPPDIGLPAEPGELPPTKQFVSPSIQAVRFAVQLAAFRTNPQAEGLRAMLQGSGYAAYVVEANVPEAGRYYRVRVGPFGTSEEAREVAVNLQDRFSEQLVDFWIVPYGQ